MPCPTGLVVKKGSKILPMMFLANADAGVGHFDAHIIARRHDRGAQRGGVRHGFVGGRDRHRAAFGHGVARIDHQIDDGVGKLGLVGMHRPQVGSDVRA